MEKFNIRLADHIFEINLRYPENRAFFRDYIDESGKSAEIVVLVSDDELEKTVETVGGSPKSAELTALYRPIAEYLPTVGGFVFHGAAICYGGKGYIFTAPSGTGKSTHIRLWRRYLGKSVDIINGDKPIITVKDGEATVHGTPWAGKELWQKNQSFPLGGICLLRRGENCSAGDADIGKSLSFLLGQIYMPRESDGTVLTVDLLDTLLKTVPLKYLYCDISTDAVRKSFEALTGESFDEHRISINNN